MTPEIKRSIGGILVACAVILVVASNWAVRSDAMGMAATQQPSYIIASATPGLPTMEPTATVVPADQPAADQPAADHPAADQPAADHPAAGEVEPAGEVQPADQVQQLLTGDIAPAAPAAEVEPAASTAPATADQVLPANNYAPQCASRVSDPYCNLPILTIHRDDAPVAEPYATMTADQEEYSRRRTR